MAGSRNNKVGRQAAMAAADRVSLLLTVVEKDEFLSEVLHSANATMVDMQQAQPAEDRPEVPQARRAQAPQTGTRVSLLGPTYHSAKQRALRLRGPAPAGRGRPLGRA